MFGGELFPGLWYAPAAPRTAYKAGPQKRLRSSTVEKHQHQAKVIMLGIRNARKQVFVQVVGKKMGRTGRQANRELVTDKSGHLCRPAEGPFEIRHEL